MPPFHINLCVLYHLPCILCKLAEQHTKEQQDTEAVAGKTSNLETKVPESTVQTVKDSLPLSLADVNEMIIQDSFPEEVNLDAIVEEGGNIEEEDNSKKSSATIIIYG